MSPVLFIEMSIYKVNFTISAMKIVGFSALTATPASGIFISHYFNLEKS